MARILLFSASVIGLALAGPVQAAPAQSATAAESASAQVTDPPIQLVPRTHEERERAFHAQHRVILNVQVTDGLGRPATGLAQGDFAVLDDRRPRSIASFRALAGDAPGAHAHVVLVLDAVNSPTSDIGSPRRAIEKYLRQSRGHLPYPTSVAVVSQNGTEVSSPSRDTDSLIADLRRFAQNARGIDCAAQRNASGDLFGAAIVTPDWSGFAKSSQDWNEGECKIRRFKLSVTALDRLVKRQLDEPGRAIMVWVGAGWPLLDGPAFAGQTIATRHRFLDYLVELSAAIQQAQVTLDAVTSPSLLRDAGLRREAWQPSAPTSQPGPQTSAQPSDEASAADLSLPALARQSGGRLLEANKDMAGGIASAVSDAQSYYMLAFDTDPAPTVPGTYRPIEIKVGAAGLTVRTNTAYYAQP